MSALQGKTIVLGVSGGIAAYKASELCSRLVKAGASVRVIMTRNACQFLQPMTLETLSMHPVATDVFARPHDHREVEHIALAKAAELFVIAPATANIIAKIACGLGDDMLSTTVLATKAPLLIAPAMNTQMYQAAATQQNIQTLKARGVSFVGPEGGLLACGDVGAGRMSEPADILSAIEAYFENQRPRDYEGLRAVVTAGPTREMLDPVRFLTNRSSGKMGYAIAEALAARGAEVSLVSGPVEIPAPAGVTVQSILSTQDLLSALTPLAETADVLIQAAAPADYTMDAAPEKLKKQGDQPLTLTLRQTPDVAKAVGEKKRAGQFFMGFAAETEQLLDNARRKLLSKHLDLICLNDVSQPGAGFEVDTNQLTLVSAHKVMKLPLLSKREAADRLLDEILNLRKGAM